MEVSLTSRGSNQQKHNPIQVVPHDTNKQHVGCTKDSGKHKATVPLLQNLALERPKVSAQKLMLKKEVDKKVPSFQQFDAVQDHSDHYYTKKGSDKGGSTVGNDWTKQILHEWKTLEKNLPEAILVRVYEKRMDLLRAVIVGPAGTPYHDGLFFFDIHFPRTYPQVPPLVHYHSGGLRLNPNLYASGKVCLSLLNTWTGQVCEKWNPSQSTILQVLVSIQALVLNAKPYFNEPGFEVAANTPHGEKKSMAYSENAFLLSCKTMMYSIRRPPKHFEDFVAGHFGKQGCTIIAACRAYMRGAQVECVVEVMQDVQGDMSCSRQFKTSLEKTLKELSKEFSKYGVDCNELLVQTVDAGAAKTIDTKHETSVLSKVKNMLKDLW